MTKRFFNFLMPSHIRRSLILYWQDMDKFNPLIVLFFIALIGGAVGMGFKLSSDHSRLRDIRCLAMNVYHEARGEPIKGKYAVGFVTVNRTNSKRFANDLCQVVYKRNWSKRYKRYVSAFSWTNDVNTDIPENSESWIEAVNIAKDIYDKKVENNVVGALHYHADYVSPRWAKKKQRLAKIGRHIFYN